MRTVGGTINVMLAAARAQAVQRPGELDGEFLVFQRLYDEVRGGHLIAADRILAHARHKNERDLFVLFTQQAGGGHAVHHRHHDVHIDDVAVAAVFFEEIDDVQVLGDPDRQGVLRAIAFDTGLELVGLRLVVFDDGDLRHNSLTSLSIVNIATQIGKVNSGLSGQRRLCGEKASLCGGG